MKSVLSQNHKSHRRILIILSPAGHDRIMGERERKTEQRVACLQYQSFGLSVSQRQSVSSGLFLQSVVCKEHLCCGVFFLIFFLKRSFPLQNMTKYAPTTLIIWRTLHKILQDRVLGLNKS